MHKLHHLSVILVFKRRLVNELLVVSVESVKLWLFEDVKRYGSYFEKTALRDSGSFRIFP